MVMKNNENEEELQSRIEGGASTNGLDARAYRKVFHTLAKEPDYQLPADFAEKIAGRISIRQEKRFFDEYVWFALGILSLGAAFVSTVLLTGFRLDFGFLNRMGEYKGLVLFGGGFILFLNWLDKRLVANRQARHRF
jgi:hypothetical protein